MRLDGALEPHHGAPANGGSSTGVKKYRDKLCEKQGGLGVSHLGSSENNNNRASHQTSAVQQQQQQQLQKQHQEGRLRNIIKRQRSAEINEKHRTSTAAVGREPRYADIVSCMADDSTSAISANATKKKRVMSLASVSLYVRCCGTWLAALSISAAKMMRVQQSIVASKCQSFSFLAALVCLFSAIVLLPGRVRCDDSGNFFAVNSFSMGPETTTTEFDYASRGQKKFGDKCENTLECGFPGSICDPKKKSCQCTEDLPVTNHIDKCGKEAAVNESCFFNEQCEVKYFQTECRDGRCVCRFEMSPIWAKDGTVECKGRQDKRGPETYLDPAMIGVLVGMALMFIIICVVLRLFSQARWHENRTIFNTPNPRLMNVSLLRESKLLHGQERRGSRMSVRAPSRQPSMASLRPHSPNPSLGKTGSRSSSHGNGSNASATSLRSTRSNSVAPVSHHERKGSAHQQHHHQQQQQQPQPQSTNITANPAAESVTVEIIEPEK